MEIRRCNVWWIWWMNQSFPSQAVTAFAWSSKKHVVLRYPDGRLCVFCWLILDAFRQVLLSFGLTGSSTCWNYLFGFLEGTHNRGLPSNPTIWTTSPSLDEDQPLVWLVVVHFACPMISSIPHYCTVSTFHSPPQFVLKTEHFHYVSVENHMWKYSQEDFFHLTYVEPKHQSD